MLRVLGDGALLGFSIAAPVGPIGILCIRRTLAAGRAVGFLSGLGAATADAAYGALAAFGLTAASRFLTEQEGLLRLIGGGFLIVLGAKTFLARPIDPAVGPATLEPRAAGLAAAYISTLLLTLANPMTVISFAAIFVGMGLGRSQSDPLLAASLVGGVFAGSAAWWLILSFAAGALRSRTGPRLLRWVNRTSGVVLVAFGALAILAPPSPPAGPPEWR